MLFAIHVRCQSKKLLTTQGILVRYAHRKRCAFSPRPVFVLTQNAVRYHSLTAFLFAAILHLHRIQTMNTIVYHGITSERLALYIKHGGICPLPETEYKPVSSFSNPHELVCIANSGNPDLTNDELRVAFMWGMVGEIASQNYSKFVYVLELIVPDQLVTRRASMCAVDLSKEALRLSLIRRVYRFPVTTRERMIAAAFCRLQAANYQFGVDIDWNEFHIQYLPERVLQNIVNDMMYTEIPEPIHGDCITADMVPVGHLNPILPYCAPSTKEVRDAIARLRKALFEEAWSYAPNATDYSAEIDVPLFGRVKIDMGRFLMEASPIVVARVLMGGSCSESASTVVDFLAPQCTICAGALEIVDTVNSTKRWIIGKEASAQIPDFIGVIFFHAKEWLAEHNPEKYEQVQSIIDKVNNSEN